MTDRFAAGAHGPSAAALLFAAGLFASLLPCVYPLYPVTAAVIRGRPGDGRLHAVTYYAGLAVTYGALGALAGALGGAFNTLLRLAATQLAIGGLLVVLAFATAGWLHLPIFEPRRPGTGDGFAGTFILGASAGFLSSACVGPVVVGVLVELATGTEAVTAAAVVGASARMLAFGLGVGVPFLAIGLFGLRLPRSGAWMAAVQYTLAALLLVFAGSYLVKGLQIAGLDATDARTVVGTAAASVACAFAMQSRELARAVRLERSLAGVGLVAAASVMFHHLDLDERSPDGRAVAPSDSDSSSPRAEPPVEVDGNLTWHLDPDAAYAEAKQRGRNVFIDFHGTWCTNCKAFKKLTHTDEELNRALQKAVLLEVDDRTAAFDRYRADERFPELKVGLPFFAITDPDGHLLYKTSDYLATDEMALFLEG